MRFSSCLPLPVARTPPPPFGAESPVCIFSARPAAVLDALLLRVVPAVLYSAIFYPMSGFQMASSKVALFFGVLALFSATVGALSMAVTTSTCPRRPPLQTRGVTWGRAILAFSHAARRYRHPWRPLCQSPAILPWSYRLFVPSTTRCLPAFPAFVLKAVCVQHLLMPGGRGIDRAGLGRRLAS
jgi:hypothetical protein